MKPLNLKEFAESLLLGEHGDFAQEILENIQAAEDLNQASCWIADVTRLAPEEITKAGDAKTYEWIDSRLDMLAKIEARLEKAGFFDPDCSALEVLESLCDDYEAADVALIDAGFTEGDLAEKVALALEKIPAVEPLEYDL